MRVAIIGAGPAGLSAAFSLARHGADVEIFEASDSTGGLGKTFALWGQRVDLGPHRFFTNDEKVTRLWHEVLEGQTITLNRISRVFYRGKFMTYPVSPWNLLQVLGARNALACGAGLARSKIQTRVLSPNASAEDWLIQAFGRPLYELFFKEDCEKIWGIPCRELDFSLAAQRNSSLSVADLARKVLSVASPPPRNAGDTFSYPIRGAGDLYDCMVRKIGDMGGKIHLATPLQSMRLRQNRVTTLAFKDGERGDFDEVVSTMPLPLLISRMGIPSARLQEASAALKFRATVLVYLHLKGDNFFKDLWVHVHSKDLKVGRITNFRNWSPALHGDSPNSILALEYWCDEGDPIWTMTEQELVPLAEREMGLMKLLPDPSLILNRAVVRIGKCFPVQTCGFAEHISLLRETLDPIRNLTVIGRNGSFKYNSQDHSLLMGLLAAENILSGTRGDTWKVNAPHPRAA